MNRPARTLTLAAAYIGTIAAANLATAHLGLAHLGPVTVTAGTFAIGLSFATRDALDDATGRRTLPVLAAIVAGATLSAALAPVHLAVASGITILLAELADMAVFRRLRERSRLGAWIASNVVAAPIDSVLFLWLAGFPLAGWLGQTAVKVVVGVATPLLLAAIAWLIARLIARKESRGAVLRHRLHRAGA